MRRGDAGRRGKRMDVDVPWQTNYTDLGDDRTIHFAGECVICGARYATPPVRLRSGKDADSISPEDFGREKYAAFTLFDAAFRELAHPCPRCGHVGCPDCWDGDHTLCGACVAEARLDRSPHQGLLTRGPLADGRLERIEPGRYSDPTRPAWLSALLATKPALDDTPFLTAARGSDASTARATTPDAAPSVLEYRSPLQPVPVSPLPAPSMGAPSVAGVHSLVVPQSILAPVVRREPAPRQGPRRARRVAFTLLSVVVVLLVVAVAAAVISPGADAFELRYLHIDVPAFFTYLTQAVKNLWHLVH